MPLDRIRSKALPVEHGTFLEEPHIAMLGQALSSALGEAANPWVEPAHSLAFALQTGTSQATPIVCVPGAGAAVTSFLPFVGALGSSQPIIAMQPRGQDGRIPPHGAIELAAHRYLRALDPFPAHRAALHMVGHSFGGWAVFEMACQMERKGMRVASLTLIDSEAPGVASGVHDCSRDLVVERFLDVVSMQAGRAVVKDRERLRELDAAALLRALHDAFVAAKLMPARSKPEALQGSLATFSAACRTQTGPAAPYEGTVHLVQVPDDTLSAEDNERALQLSQTRWREVAPHLRVWRGPGNHMSILEQPHVAQLAAWWRATASLDKP